MNIRSRYAQSRFAVVRHYFLEADRELAFLPAFFLLLGGVSLVGAILRVVPLNLSPRVASAPLALSQFGAASIVLAISLVWLYAYGHASARFPGEHADFGEKLQLLIGTLGFVVAVAIFAVAFLRAFVDYDTLFRNEHDSVRTVVGFTVALFFGVAVPGIVRHIGRTRAHSKVK